jgi:tetratricopeptide (TPR) repeat protein
MATTSRRKLGRRQARDLDIEIGFLEALLRRDPDYVEALQVLGDDYSDGGRFDDGLRVDLKLVALRPEDPNVRFNYACSLALTGQLDCACFELERSFDLGYRDIQWLQQDPDLAALRKHPGFRKIRARIRALKSDPITGN